jgi:hypothetical protein
MECAANGNIRGQLARSLDKGVQQQKGAVYIISATAGAMAVMLRSMGENPVK